MTTHTFDVQVQAEMTRRAWNAWFFRGRRMWRLAVASSLLLAAILVDVWGSRFGIRTVVAATVLGFTFLLFVTAYFVGLHRSLAKREAVVDGKVSYTLTEATIEAKSSLGHFALAWSVISEARRYGDLVLLGFRGAAYSTIPANQIPPDALAFMVERAKASGAKIIRL
jgi:hypothetical protein